MPCPQMNEFNFRECLKAGLKESPLISLDETLTISEIMQVIKWTLRSTVNNFYITSRLTQILSDFFCFYGLFKLLTSFALNTIICILYFMQKKKGFDICIFISNGICIAYIWILQILLFLKDSCIKSQFQIDFLFTHSLMVFEKMLIN